MSAGSGTWWIHEIAAASGGAAPEGESPHRPLQNPKGDPSKPRDWNAMLIERMRLVAGHLTYRAIGRRTDAHPETVRRYMVNGAPSARFVAAFCNAFGINADWLLDGLGPPMRTPGDGEEESARGPDTSNDTMQPATFQLNHGIRLLKPGARERRRTASEQR